MKTATEPDMAEEKLITFSELCILSGGKVFSLSIKMRTNNSVWLPKLQLQGGQCILVHSATSCPQTGLTSIQEDDLCGYELKIPQIHERREIDPINNLGSD